MSIFARAGGVQAALARYPHQRAFSIQLGRNAVVQTLGLGMTALMVLSVLPWSVTLAWTAATAGAIVAEHHLLRAISRGGAVSRGARLASPILRVGITSLYAIAALALFLAGRSGARLFAFALVSASMVHVLMRHYRSPAVLLASLSPYVAILLAFWFDWGRQELMRGHILSALAPGFALMTLAVQAWSARAQMDGAWKELDAARRQAEDREHAAQSASLAKSQFLATMSHELRTPLNGVLGMAQALAGEDLTPLQRQRLAVIRRSGESLLAVLNDLLDLSKIEASALELEIGEFDLDHLVRGIASIYQPMAARKGLTFAFHVADEAKGRWRGDGPRVRRVLHGLCDNAVKFTDRGGCDLIIDIERDRVCFRVADSGPGIEAACRERLFEGFFQADSSATRRHGGLGVGLAVCGRLAALMDGTIEVDSEPGRGSTFTFAIPLQSAAIPQPCAAVDAGQTAELRVLAAEDNIANQMVLKTLLEPAGIAPTLVINGLEAVAAWESQSWDVVLMDIQMPEMDGIEAARVIRRRERETGRPRTPIVAVTANAMTHQVAEYRSAGMDAVVAKPFDVRALFHTIQSAMAETDAEPGAVMRVN